MKKRIKILTSGKKCAGGGFLGKLLLGVAFSHEMIPAFIHLFRESCGSPFFCLEQAMQLTPYLVVCRHPTIPGQVLLFATSTGALISIVRGGFCRLTERPGRGGGDRQRSPKWAFWWLTPDTEQTAGPALPG